MRGAVIAITLAAVGAAAPAHACQLIKAAELPVTMEGPYPFVPVKINGLETKLLVDSGAFFNTVDAESAKRAGLKGPYPGVSLMATGIGGDARLTIGRADTVMLADIPLKKVDFLIHQRPLTAFSAGLLGQNVLGALDVEYDLAHGVIRIFKPKGCGSRANLAYWSRPEDNLSVLPTRPTNVAEPHTRFSAKVNGVSVTAMLDSGAWSSLLSASAAARTGMRPDSPGARSEGLSGGIGRHMVEAWSAPFASISIGGEEVRNTRLRIAKHDASSFDLLLGADFLLSHRILVANSQNQIYFTYNGGPVFRFPDKPAEIAAATPSLPPEAGEAAKPDVDAATLGRQAAAHAARRDYASAIRNYSQALAAKPDDVELLRGRAQAYLATKQADRAAVDLDQALKLAPNHVLARLVRGGLRLKKKDVAGAQADFDAALQAAPHERYLPLSIANQYSDAGQIERAIGLYDSWIAAHPKDQRIAEAFNARCWTRIIWNRDLNLAIADCDAALRRARPNSATLNSRGMLRYRLGQFDAAIADFDASLRLQPNDAWSLYGRGLAKARKGPAGAGDADLKTAAALKPDLPEEAARYGLVPA